MKERCLPTQWRELDWGPRLGWKRKHFGWILLCALGVFIFLSLISHPAVKQNIARGYFDFAAFYGAGRIVHAGLGERLYQYEMQREIQQQSFGRRSPLLFNHGAFESLIFVPLASLSPIRAYSVWASVNLLLLLTSYFVLRSYLRDIQSLGLRVSLVLSSFPCLSRSCKARIPFYCSSCIHWRF